MNNNKLMEQLYILKSNHISYKSIAEKTEIPLSTFYYYLKHCSFPYSARKRIEELINKEYKEVIDDEQ